MAIQSIALHILWVCHRVSQSEELINQIRTCVRSKRSTGYSQKQVTSHFIRPYICSSFSQQVVLSFPNQPPYSVSGGCEPGLSPLYPAGRRSAPVGAYWSSASSLCDQSSPTSYVLVLTAPMQYLRSLLHLPIVCQR